MSEIATVEMKNLESLPKTQEQYMEKVLSQIPAQVKNILNIGCGAGGMAKNMIQRGYTVTCCEPDPFLLNKTFAATNFTDF